MKAWRALTEFEMVRAIRYAGKVYQNEMARSCRSLGYLITDARDKKGTITGFEIVGVPKPLRDRFSKRRAEIETGIAQFQEAHGRAPSPAEIHAITVATRDAKLAEITTPAVLAAQRAQLSPSELASLTHVRDTAITRSQDPSHTLGLGREHESLCKAVPHLYERRSVVLGHELLAEALNQNLGYQELDRLTAKAQGTALIGLTDEPWLHESFATPQGLTLEQWAVGFVAQTQNRFNSLGPTTPILSTHLSPEQREAALAILASRDQVACLRGAAGVGKTTVLAELHREILATGAPVFVCAPTSSAADTLKKDGLPATTLAEFLQTTAAASPSRLQGAVLIVVEAGLASNAQGAALLKLADQHQTRVLFLGDTKQHNAVEAGDFLRVLETHSPLKVTQLNAIRRQEHQAYREAVGCLATGAARLGLERLDELGWIKEGKSAYLTHAAQDYVALASAQRGPVLAVTPTWAEHEAFTFQVRALLKESGALGPSTILETHEPLKWTRTQQQNPANYASGLVVTFHGTTGPFRNGDSVTVARSAHGQVFVQTPAGERPLPLKMVFNASISRPQPLEVAVGDRLLIRANDRKAKVFNGEILTVARMEGPRLRFSDGRSIDTARFKAFTHGYAVTSHASQSKTVDHVIVAAERLDAKAAYVACSRGRLTCTVHTPDKQALLDRLPAGNRTAALDMLNKDALVARNRVPSRFPAWNALVERARELKRTAGQFLERGQMRFRQAILEAARRRTATIDAHRQVSRDHGYSR